MIKNYFKVIIQNLIRNKAYSFINILGLSVGLAVCLVIIQYVRFENSYDRFHTNYENKYRVYVEFTYSDGSINRDAANFGTTGEALKDDFPEVKNYVRITPEYGRVVFKLKNQAFEEQKVYYADPNMFVFFDYKLLEGDPKTALMESGSVVLSRKSAEKYFGPFDTWTESPLNQVILMNNKEPLKITGIMEDSPGNSHFKSEAIISIKTFFNKNDAPHWDWNDFYTYIELTPGFDYKVFESKLPEFLAKYKEKDSQDKLRVQPLHEIHLHSNLDYELNPNGSAQTVYFLSIISLLILFIAWVNYVNLSTARAEYRAKEIGVRKVNGASRGEVMFQFLLESFFVNFIALFLAVVFVNIALPVVGEFLGKPLHFSLFDDKQILVYISIVYVAGSILSGLYPAIVISAFKPISIFKTTSSNGARGKSGLRQSLVIFQFIMSSGLITGMLIIENQMQFIRDKELGFNFDKTIVLNAPSTLGNDSLFSLNYQRFKDDLVLLPDIENVAVSSALPGKSHNDIDMAGGLKMVGDDDNVNHTLASFRVDENFVDVFKLKIVAGSNFSKSQLNRDAVLLNRKGSELLGYKNPEEIIGKKMNYWGREKEIVGVIENYHHKSLKNSFEPTVFRGDIGSMLYITVKMSNNTHTEQTLEEINRIWNARFSSDPFQYFFLDDQVNNQYKADIQFSRIFTVFSGFSIFIACLGLFGLVSYSVTVRMKEIGVRKVLGASLSGIVLLFTKDYVKLLLIAFFIGIPLAHYILNLWVENFEYKAAFSWWLFIIPAITVSILAMIAVSLQVINAALVNPAKSLRNE